MGHSLSSPSLLDVIVTSVGTVLSVATLFLVLMCIAFATTRVLLWKRKGSPAPSILIGMCLCLEPLVLLTLVGGWPYIAYLIKLIKTTHPAGSVDNQLILICIFWVVAFAFPFFTGFLVLLSSRLLYRRITHRRSWTIYGLLTSMSLTIQSASILYLIAIAAGAD